MERNKTDALKQLFIALNAKIETGDGFTSYTLDSKDFNPIRKKKACDKWRRSKEPGTGTRWVKKQ